MVKKAQRVRETVYVIGAGFSAGLGYPQTKTLLVDLWGRLNSFSQDKLAKVIRFHHPAFDPKKTTSFPDIEQLLTEISVNLDLFGASRPMEGGFTKAQLEDVKNTLLSTIAEWFHELFKPAIRTPWLSKITKRLRAENS